MNKFLKNYKIILLFILLLFIFTLFCSFSYAQTISYDIANSVFRLHVIANSDSDEDQNLKYKVRDALLAYMNTLTSNCSSKEEVINIANSNKDKFREIAIKTIRENGFDYDVNVEIGNFEFPTKTYGDISLPSGFYDALKVEIGSAKGKNWWCVMFPPLCFIDISSGTLSDESKNYLKNNLSDEDYALISNDSSSDLQFKFKILEFFGNNNIISAKK